MKRVCYLLAAAAAAVSLSGTAHAAAFMNGSFETGPDIPNEDVAVPNGSFVTLGAGSFIGPWRVGGGGVDYIGTYWEASNGVRSVDLNAGADSFGGSVSQQFDTVAGQLYQVTFDMAGNPDGLDDLKVETAWFDDAPMTQTFTFQVTPSNTRSDMGWVGKSFFFTAGDSQTTLTFASQNIGGFGPALDNVSVAAVPEPSTWAMMLVGFGAVGYAFRRRPKYKLAQAV